MTEQLSQAGVRQALFDLHRYLSDQVAPMMVTDAVELLVQCPPEVVAKEIHGWIDAQFRGPSDGVTVSDCIYHAMKKLHMMTEFELIEKEMLESYLQGLASVVIGFCPEGDRQLLADNLSRLGQAEVRGPASPVGIIHRQGGRDNAAAAPETGAVSADVARGVRQLSIFVERLAQVAPGNGGGAAASDGALARQAFATAAVSSHNDAEFQNQLQRLSQVGVDASMEKVFRSLGDGLPGWALNQGGGGSGAVELPPSRSAEAMHKILAMAQSPEQGTQRFNEMMQAAIEQFNAGRLVQAATMLDLANRIASEKKLDAEVVKNMRGRAHESLSPEQLREFSDNKEKHEVLRRLLGFFPALTPKGLLAGLQNEERRERRKLFLALLEVHGAPARAMALELLDVSVSDGTADPEGFLQRNLIFLLRRIPPSDKPSDREIELLVQLSALDRPPLALKESIATLGHVKHPVAERTLMVRLSELEKTLTETEVASTEATELVGLIDRTISALAKQRSANGYRTIVAHALKREPSLGDTMARLDELSDHDLSGDKQLIDRLVKILEQQLPTKVLGFVVGKKEDQVVHLIRALSGTPSPVVRQALEEIVSRFPELELTEEATRTLAGFGASMTRRSNAPSKTLTGDVELFGLPNLFQTLADSQVTGVLTLADREGDTAGMLSLEGGRIHGCQVGGLRGEVAFFQLFEKPVPGTFTFTSQKSDSLESDAGTEPMEVLPAILEAMRRHDEFNQARALVPDDVALKPGDHKPQPMTDETDVDFMRTVWSKASTGVTPETCESLLQVDSYRVRRLYAHWIEMRALEPR